MLKKANYGEYLPGKNDACIIVDMQNDFMDSDKGSLYVQGMKDEVLRDKLIRNIKMLCSHAFGEIDVTEDLHFVGNIEFKKHGKHCLAGTWGQLYINELADIYRSANKRLPKGIEIAKDGYSVKSSPMFTEHVWELREKNIERIFICGVAYNYCVCQSAMDYAELGFKVYIVRNATRSVPPPYGEHPDIIRKRLFKADIFEAYL